MNTKALITAATLVMLSGAAFAQHGRSDNGPKTRDQVIAELEQARADGSFYSAGEGNLRSRARAILAERERSEKVQRRAASESTRTQN